MQLRKVVSKLNIDINVCNVSCPESIKAAIAPKVKLYISNRNLMSVKATVQTYSLVYNPKIYYTYKHMVYKKAPQPKYIYIYLLHFPS